MSHPAPTVPADPIAPARPRPGVLPAVYGLLLIALAGRIVFTFWEPPFTGSLDYDVTRSLGGAFWPMNLYLGGPAHLVSFVTLTVFLVLLARGATAVVGLAGAALVGLGGTLFSIVITAEVLPFAYAADPAVFPEAQGRAMFGVLNENIGWLEPAILGGMATVAVGYLLAFVGGGLSRALPRWFVAAGLVYLVVFVALPPGLLPRAAELGFYLVEIALTAGLGWFGLRAARRSDS